LGVGSVGRAGDDVGTHVALLSGDDLVHRRQSTLGDTLNSIPGVNSDTFGGGASRPGFERLLAAICEGQVGAVFAIEASRLARNGRDWHTLIEFCGLVGAIIVDEDGVKNKFHDTLVSNAEDLCDLLRALNVTGDADLERARKKLQEALSGVTPKELRDELSTRLDVKRQVDVMLESYDWGLDGLQ
jgi:hypothetical protein